MNASTRPHVGDRITVRCTTTDRHDVTATITAETVEQIGCGCWRIGTTRPGPQPAPNHCPRMELLTGCQWHSDDTRVPESEAS